MSEMIYKDQLCGGTVYLPESITPGEPIHVSYIPDQMQEQIARITAALDRIADTLDRIYWGVRE